MITRFRHIILIMLMVLTAIHSIAQIAMPDKVCVGTDRHYYVEGMAGSVYTWTINGATQTATADFLDITWNTSGTYTLTVQEHQANCDGEIQTGVVEVITPPELEKPDPVVACFSWLLPGISQIKGLNLSGKQAFYDNSQAKGGQKINGLITSSQTVWIYDPGELPGCGDEIDFDVTILPPPKLVVNLPAPVCEPGTVDLTAPAITAGSDANLVFTYWADAAATIALTNAGTISATGTYYIKATNSGGCSATATVTVSILPPPHLEVHNPVPVCEPVTVNLVAPEVTAGSENGLIFSYWLDGAATVSLTNYTSIAAVGTHTYTIMATKLNGCSVTSTVVVTIYPLPKLVITNPAPVCEPATVDLSSTFTPESGITYTYWKDQAATIPLPDYNMVSAIGTNTFTIRATNAQDCSITRTVTVTIYPRPTASVDPQAMVCPNIPYFVASAAAANYSSILWTTSGDGTFDDKNLIKTTYTPGAGDMNAGSVKLTITASGLGEGCSADTKSIDLIIENLKAEVLTSTVTCHGLTDGAISLSNPRNGIPLYSIYIETKGWYGTTSYSGLGAGTYNVKMRDANGCVQDLGSHKILEPQLLVADVGTFTPTCKGNDGQIILSKPQNAASELVGVPGNYMYVIEKNGGAFTKVSDRTYGPTETYTFGGLATGTYTVKMYDADHPLCIQILMPTITLTEPEPLFVAATTSDVTCFGANDGTVSVTVSTGGSGNYEYQLVNQTTGILWGKGWVKASGLISAVSPGNYTLQMRDANNTDCVVTSAANYTINEPEILAGTATSTDERCWNAKDGTITIQSSSGGHGRYEYMLSGTLLADGSTFSSTWTSKLNFTNLAPGTYSLQIRDASFVNCTQPVGANYTIHPALKLVATVTPVPVKCFGEANGEILITAARNGKEPYQYSISGGATWTTSTTIASLTAGIYTVTIMDGNTCSNTLDPVEVKQPEKLEADYEHSTQPIAGKDVGTVTVTNQEGGTPYPAPDLYRYSKDGVNWQTSPVFANLDPGTYTITIADANDCSYDMLVTIRSVGLITAKFTLSDATCNGRNDGSITFYDFAGAGSGKYEVSINNGLTWVKVTGTNYTYYNLGKSTNDLTVREDGLIATESDLGRWPINEPPLIQATVVMTQPETGTTKNGIVEVSSFSGGRGSLVFRINGSAWQSNPQFTGLSKGDYIIDIRDPDSALADCYISRPVKVVGEGELTASVDIVQPRCFGLKGTLKITASGVANIEYSYDNEEAWSPINTFSLNDGDYLVSVRDANNHDNKIKVLSGVSDGAWEIASPSKLVLRSDYEWPTCQKPFATITIWGEGGTGQISGDMGVYKLPVGDSKTYTIYDQNYIAGQPGCLASQNFGSPSPSSITSEVTPTPVLCYGGTGTITFTVPTSGKAPYTYSVKSTTYSLPSAIGKTVWPNLPSGQTYTATVTDANGCKYETSVALGPMIPLTASVAVTSGSLCTGGVVINVTAIGGTAPYKIGTDRLPFSKTVNLDSGTQTFTITDANGCTTSTTLSPVAPPDLQVTATVLACTDKFASIEIERPGYDPAKYAYSIGGTATSTTLFTGLSLNTLYTVTVVDKLSNCSASTSVTTKGISVPEMPIVALTATPTCLNENGTLVVTNPTGDEYAYKISGNVYLTGGKTQTSTIFSNLKTDTYTITVINTLAGCESVPATKEVPAIPPSPVISVSGVSPKCYVDNLGGTYTITISVPPIGAYNFNGIYTFFYDGGKFDNVAIAGGTATITGTLSTSGRHDYKNIYFEANGCMSTGIATSIYIDVPEKFAITYFKVTEQPLKGTQKGEIKLTLGGGIPDYKYSWTSDTFIGTLTETASDKSYSLTNLWAGNYSVTIIDSNNCQIQRTYKVPSNLPPIAVDDDYKYNCSALHENLLVNDSDPDLPDDKIRINTTPVVSPKFAKTFNINADGTFDYEVIPGFTGADSFVYEIADKFTQTATAMVTILIAADFDGDGIADLIDPDADGDGILNVDEALPGQDWKTADFDGDGHPNWLDIDSDNDGIVDNVEAQPTAGYIPPSGKDVNHNGIDDAYDPAMGGVKIIPVNTDANLYMPDNLPDFLDTDSDNDHVPDYIEGHDLNADGKVDEGHLITGKDSDSDGLDDAWDTIPNGCNNLNATGSNAYIQDFDGDGIRDWRDDNDDDDEYPTRLEDLNGDGDYSNDVTGHVGHPEYLWYGRDCSLFIPDAFSPNDDNVHDYFQIYCIEQYPNAKMYIFDQQGNKLFEKDHYGNVDYWGSHEQAWWDGTTTNRIAAVNGKKVVPGTYYYVLKLGNGETKKSFVFVSY